MKVTAVTLLAVAVTPLHALPLMQYEQADTQSRKAVDNSILENNNNNDDNDNNTQDASSVSFNVQIDRFAQLVSTHWEFDHLETIKSTSYVHIANNMKNHINIVVHSSSSTQQHMFLATPPTLELDLLKAQIFGAIQAHAESSLPTAWDQLGDHLGQPAFEAHVKQLIFQQCSGGDTSEDTTVSYDCLSKHSSQISSQIHRYVAQHLKHEFDAVTAEFLPELLRQTVEGLHQVLSYFTEKYLSEQDLVLSLQVAPWQHESQVEMRSQLLDLLSSIDNVDHDEPEFVTTCAELAAQI